MVPSGSLVREVGLVCGVETTIEGSTNGFKNVWVVTGEKAQCLNPLVTQLEVWAPLLWAWRRAF